MAPVGGPSRTVEPFIHCVELDTVVPLAVLSPPKEGRNATDSYQPRSQNKGRATSPAPCSASQGHLIHPWLSEEDPGFVMRNRFML